MSNATENRADPEVRKSNQRKSWCGVLDRALTREFPDYQWATYWSPLDGEYGAYVTSRGDGRKATKEQELFIRAFMLGYQAKP